VGSLKDYFDSVVVVNLDRRPDRMEQFLSGIPEDWPFGPVERVPAIDGKLCPGPRCWSPSDGGWGCYRTHVRILEDALHAGVKRLLIFEDDATFIQDFAKRAGEYLDALPEDWDMAYFGGEHLRLRNGRPIRVNDEVYQPFNVNRTHAFAVNVERFGVTLYQHLHDWKAWKPGHHIDHHLGVMTETRRHNIYCPREWLVGQRAGPSDVSGHKKFPSDRWWKPAEKTGVVKRTRTPFFAILGLHSSGSSALAGVCYHLGLHLGNKLVGYHGKPPVRGGEAIWIAQFCERVANFRQVQRCLTSAQIQFQLTPFVRQKAQEARKSGTRAGVKYPQLCILGDELRAILGENLRVIASDRPIDESIASIQRRVKSAGDERLAAHQRWLWEEKERTIKAMPPEHVLRVDFASLLENTETEVNRVREFLGFPADEGRTAKAVGSVQTDRRTAVA